MSWVLISGSLTDKIFTCIRKSRSLSAPRPKFLQGALNMTDRTSTDHRSALYSSADRPPESILREQFLEVIQSNENDIYEAPDGFRGTWDTVSEHEHNLGFAYCESTGRVVSIKPNEFGSLQALIDLLKEENLNQHLQALVSAGHITVTSVNSLTTEDLRGLGFKKAHILKLSRALNKHTLEACGRSLTAPLYTGPTNEPTSRAIVAAKIKEAAARSSSSSEL